MGVKGRAVLKIERCYAGKKTKTKNKRPHKNHTKRAVVRAIVLPGPIFQ